MVKQKVLILGLGKNGGGKAAALYFGRLNHKYIVRISDTAQRQAFNFLAELEELGIKCFFEIDPKDNIKWADIVIKNPAVSPKLPQLSLAKFIANDMYYLFTSKLIQEIKIIAVTGTKGKTSTVAAITHALKKIGHDAIYCGNIGVSAFSIINELEDRKEKNIKMPDFLVIELSSWQIHDTYIALNGNMPQLELAIFTSSYADHQNTYASVDEYFDDKLKLFNQNCKKILILNSLKKQFLANTINLNKIITTFPEKQNPYINRKVELQCAYSALRLLGFKDKNIEKALLTFKGMPHRIEQVAVIDDIMFINDSSATIPEAVNFSCKNISPLLYHIILGGTDKKLSIRGFKNSIKNAASVTLLNGSFTKNRLILYLKRKEIAYSGPFESMKEAFDSALKNAKNKRDEKGQMQVVILSPGATSFEYFANEFERGNQFKKLVNQLKKEKTE